MRLNYLQLGDRVGHDEFNALVHMLLTRDYPINEVIKLIPSGFKGAYGSYYLEYEPDVLVYRDDDIQILDNTGYIVINCISELNATFKLIFGDYIYVSNSNGVIIVDLSNFKKDDLIPNNFTMEVVYKEPYINVKIGDKGVIATTSDLKEAISTIDDTATITLSGTILHNLNNPIRINSDIKIKGSAKIVNTNNLTGNLFNIDDDYSLYLKDLTFNDFTNTENGGVIYNNGILSMNKCIFNNSTSSGNGGAVYNNYGEVYSDNCEFNSCKATNGAGIFNVGDD